MIQVDSECTASDDFRQQRTLLVPLDKAHDQHYIRLNLTDKRDRAMIHKLLFYIILKEKRPTILNLQSIKDYY